MYVCICKDIKDKQIKNAMASGVDSMNALKDTLDVANCCGCCEPMVQDLLDEHHANKVEGLAIAV
ncbi:(2Fe-2S)-binding protein [Psychrobacter sp. HD31]|uniref:(2Fe-2S)-binding protein n=1 Tax=Psychrobacter sp. HD31 TaxID=3112003 RepID=UPI003DA69AFC